MKQKNLKNKRPAQIQKNVTVKTGLKAGGYSEGECANWCMNEGYPPGGVTDGECQCGYKQA